MAIPKREKRRRGSDRDNIERDCCECMMKESISWIDPSMSAMLEGRATSWAVVGERKMRVANGSLSMATTRVLVARRKHRAAFRYDWAPVLAHIRQHAENCHQRKHQPDGQHIDQRYCPQCRQCDPRASLIYRWGRARKGRDLSPHQSRATE